MNQELYHFGTKGMKWGVRRYQNKDGSLTPAGQKRQAKIDRKQAKIDQKNTDRRNKYAHRTKVMAEYNQAEAKEASKHLKSLKKYGTDHKRVKERAMNNAREDTDNLFDKYDSSSERQVSEFTRSVGASLNYGLREKEYKKQAYNELVSENKASLARHTKKAKQWQAANKAVMNMPADSKNRDYRKAIRRAKKYYDL